SEADLRSRETQEKRGRVNERVGSAEFVDGDREVFVLERLLSLLRERSARRPVGGRWLGHCRCREESEGGEDCKRRGTSHGRVLFSARFRSRLWAWMGQAATAAAA